MERLDFVRDEEKRVQCGADGKPQQTFVPFGGIVLRDAMHTCPRHGKIPTKAVVINGEESPTTCPICEREAEREQKAQAEALKRELAVAEQVERWRGMNIEREYWGKTLDDYKPRCEAQARAKAAVSRLIERKQGKVVLLGANGCGKTHLGTMAVKALGGKVLTVYEIATEIRQSYSPLAEKTELEITGELASIPMLFIDELGRTSGSAAERNWLSYILDKRHQRGLPFMIGSNSHLSRDCPNGKAGCPLCFEMMLGDDILSRLGQDTEIVTLYDAPDYRRIRK